MDSDLLTAARHFLVSYLKGKSSPVETKHPWRKDWKFALLHSLRVEAYVVRILRLEAAQLTDEEITLLRLAAILHDIARMDIRERHAEIGAQIAAGWLQTQTKPSLAREQIARVTGLIAAHSAKDGPDPDYLSAVLKDADTLDEIGVMSIFMAANWLDQQSPFFFHELRQRVADRELTFCDQKLEILNTQGARRILNEKKSFLAGFIAQLDDELNTNLETEQILAELTGV